MTNMTTLTSLSKVFDILGVFQIELKYPLEQGLKLSKSMSDLSFLSCLIRFQILLESLVVSPRSNNHSENFVKFC